MYHGNLRTFAPLTLAAMLSIGVGMGPIDPPNGPVGPTMKTLAEVEPRTAINQDNTPGDSEAAFVIDQPGSYYLTQNYTILGRPNFPDPGFTPKDGIRITADHVTLDLNGFALLGGSGARDGIVIPQNFTGVRVHNGSVSGFSQNGITTPQTTEQGELSLHNLRVNSNASNGIDASSAVVTDSVALFNGVTGIRADTVKGCEASDNFNGIFAEQVTDTRASDNTEVGISARQVINSSAIGNENGIRATLVSGCFAGNNNATGILVDGLTAGLASDCVSSNNNIGFSLGDGVIRGCTAENNTIGFFSKSFRGHFDHNFASFNQTGYQAETPLIGINRTVYTGNVAQANDTNWNLTGSVSAYVVELPTAANTINGNSGGTAFDANPWANFTR